MNQAMPKWREEILFTGLEWSAEETLLKQQCFMGSGILELFTSVFSSPAFSRRFPIVPTLQNTFDSRSEDITPDQGGSITLQYALERYVKIRV